MQSILSSNEKRRFFKQTINGVHPYQMNDIYHKLKNQYGDKTDYKIKKVLQNYFKYIEQNGGENSGLVKSAALKNLIDIINTLGPTASKNLPQVGDALTAYALSRSGIQQPQVNNRSINLGPDNYHIVLELLKKIVPIVNPGMKRELLNILMNYYNIQFATLTEVQTQALLAALL